MTLRFAVVGAGPSGFYTAEALLKAGHHVDLFDKLPTPYGLVRYGVAPDHPKLKQVTAVFDRVAEMPGFRFLGNVAIDRDVSVAELRRAYIAVVVCCGAERDRPLGIPGETLAGVHGGLSFVGWYNGHPAHRALAPELDGRNAVVIGLGNVALDVARILGKEPASLARTDIAAHALDALHGSGIETITVVARRGPSQARCTEKELREFGTLPGRAMDQDGRVIPGLYVAGWIKRGASGTIGTNRADAVETVASLITDLPHLAERRAVTGKPMDFAGTISFAGWKAIDRIEISRGAVNSKPREKIVSIEEMVSHALV